MIEFKADCGHTVRAKDENAGGAVRCSYCGKETQVPESGGDELDFLFRDLEQGEEISRKARRKRRKAGGPPTPGGAKRRSFDPFAVVLKLCYAAGLIVIVIVVGQRFVVPLLKEGVAEVVTKRSAEDGGGVAHQKKNRLAQRNAEASPQPYFGLIDKQRIQGLYVSSTPPGAAVFYIEQSQAPASGRIHDTKSCRRFSRGSISSGSKIKDGTYVVEVVLPWNNRGLAGYPGYPGFRRALLGVQNEVKRREMLEKYFLGDEAEDVFFDDTTDDKKYIVRQYRGVTLRAGRSSGVRALFLPRVAADDRPLRIEELVTGHLPQQVRYNIDRPSVDDELDVYDVPVAEREWLYLALQRLGAIAYVMPNKQTMFFEVDIYDGTLTAKFIHQRRR